MNKMESSWRSRVKCLARIEFLLVSMQLLMLNIFLLYGVIALFKGTLEETTLEWVKGMGNMSIFHTLEKEDLTLIREKPWVIWLSLGVASGMAVVLMWANSRLLKASDVGKDTVDALRKLSTWRMINLIYIISLCASIVVTPYFLFILSIIILRCITLFAVRKFTLELEMDLPRRIVHVPLAGLIHSSGPYNYNHYEMPKAVLN